MQIKRICSGEYEVSHGEYVASISRFDHLDYEYGQWVVTANWDRSTYTDPIIYLKDAKKVARRMIDEAIMEELQRLERRNAEVAARLGL